MKLFLVIALSLIICVTLSSGQTRRPRIKDIKSNLDNITHKKIDKPWNSHNTSSAEGEPKEELRRVRHLRSRMLKGHGHLHERKTKSQLRGEQKEVN